MIMLCTRCYRVETAVARSRVDVLLCFEGRMALNVDEMESDGFQQRLMRYSCHVPQLLETDTA